MNESKLIDLETINSLRKVLEDGVFELFEEFISDGPRAMQRLETAISNMDALEIGRAAHYLKGSAGNIGAIALSNACMTLELQSRNGDIQDIYNHLANIKQLYAATVEYMERQEK